MGQRDETGDPESSLLIGPGRRARECGVVLSALAGLDERGEPRPQGLVRADLGDLEELLTRRPREGLLILESGHVPSEDVGFVRRFLERHPAWRLAVVGEDPQDPRSRALLALGRSQWLPWPPDLEQLRVLLAGPGASAAPAPDARSKGREARPGPREARNGGNGGSGESEGVDLAALLEELLASAALRGDETPRFAFRSEAAVVVRRERGPLGEGLGGLIELARRCAGNEGLVRAALDPKGDAVLVELEFPRAALPEEGLAALLEGDGAEVEPGLGSALERARAGAALLRASGGEVVLEAGDEGRVLCRVRLGTVPPPPRGRRAAKPEDPFA